jgi:hypothetical protein
MSVHTAFWQDLSIQELEDYRQDFQQRLKENDGNKDELKLFIREIDQVLESRKQSA